MCVTNRIPAQTYPAPAPATVFLGHAPQLMPGAHSPQQPFQPQQQMLAAHAFPQAVLAYPAGWAPPIRFAPTPRSPWPLTEIMFAQPVATGLFLRRSG